MKNRVIMKGTTKAYLITFLILAVMAFVLSTVCGSVFDIDTTNSKKLTAIEDDSFDPHDINNVQVIVPKTENKTQHNNTTVIGNIMEIFDNAWNSLVR